MAKQNSVIKIRGSVDGLTFMETKDGHQVRKKVRTLSKETYLTDPKFSRLRENMSEFNRAIDAGKLFRVSTQEILLNCTDKRFFTRLTGFLVKAILTDPVNRRGQRNMMEADVSILKGLDFNLASELTVILKVPFTSAIDRVTGKLTVDFPSVEPEDSMLVPRGASHFKYHSCGLDINFGTGEYVVKLAESVGIPVNNGATPVVNQLHELNPNSTNPIFLLAGIKFYQEVNGVFYPLKNGASNAMRIVQAESAP